VIQRGLVLGGLLLLAAGSWWLLKTLGNEENLVDNDQTRFLPDYAVVDFTSTHTDDAGQVKYQLQGRLLKHYPVVDTEITAPYLVFYQAGQPVWYAKAETGLLSSDGETLHLVGKTLMWRSTEQPDEAVTIVSRDVLVKPTIEYAETAAETDIETQAGLTQSRGMRLYMRTQQAELLSAVRGRYVSRRNQQRGLSPR